MANSSLLNQVPTQLLSTQFGYPVGDVAVVWGGDVNVHFIITADANVATNHASAPNGSIAVSTNNGYVWAKSGAIGGIDGTWVQQHA